MKKNAPRKLTKEDEDLFRNVYSVGVLEITKYYNGRPVTQSTETHTIYSQIRNARATGFVKERFIQRLSSALEAVAQKNLLISYFDEYQFGLPLLEHHESSEGLNIAPLLQLMLTKHRDVLPIVELWAALALLDEMIGRFEDEKGLEITMTALA